MAAGDDLEGYWKLDETSGTRADSSDNSRDLSEDPTIGYVADAPYQTNSADFDAANDSSLYRAHADLPSSWLGRVNCTVYTTGAFFKFDTTTNGLDIIFGTEGVFYCGQVQSSGNRVRMWHHNGLGQHTIDSDNTIDTGWHHVCCRWNGTGDDELSLWIDGSKQTTTATPPAARNYGAAWVVGAYRTTGLWELDGKISEHFMFHRSLTDQEIQDISDGGMDNFLGTVEAARRRITIIVS